VGPLSSLVLKVIPVNVSPRLFWISREPVLTQTRRADRIPLFCLEKRITECCEPFCLRSLRRRMHSFPGPRT
jgi:hypothetical protein